MGHHAYPKMRSFTAKDVSESLESCGKHVSDQGAIWNEIPCFMRTLGSDSRTEAMHDIYEDKEKELDFYVKTLNRSEGCQGVIVAINGEVVCADIFDKSETMNKFWDKLVRSYALNAIEEIKEVPEPSRSRVEEFFKEVLEGEFKPYDSVGLGEDVRIKGRKEVGSALVCNNKVIHMSLFKAKEKFERNSL
jgi:hypothetical protein